MNILFVIDYFQPKLGYSEYFLVKEFQKQGHIVSILTSDYYFPFPDYKQTVAKVLGPRKSAAGKHTESGITVYREKQVLELFSRSVFFHQEEYLKRLQPDIVIANGIANYNTVKLAILKEKYDYKLIAYSSHLPSEFNRETVALKKIIYWLFRLFFANGLNKQVNKFVAVQQATIGIVKNHFGITKKIDYIPLGTDTSLFRFNYSKRNELRKKYRVNDHDFVIIYTGKIIAAKGIVILFQAFNLLCRKHDNLKLVIVGEGPKEYLDFCYSRLDKRFYKKIVHITMQKNNILYQYYSMADMAVWPLQDSISMNDAASCSLPFVASNAVGDSLRLSNDNGLIYNNGNSQNLAEKIEYLYLNPATRKKMAANGRRLAEDKLSWEKIALQYLKL